jgi:hypothetical protein
MIEPPMTHGPADQHSAEKDYATLSTYKGHFLFTIGQMSASMNIQVNFMDVNPENPVGESCTFDRA